MAAVDEGSVETVLRGLFEPDVHAKRIASLAHATLGVVHAASLGVHAIGRAMAEARGTAPKHGVKQVDRLLSNEGVSPWQLAARWVPYCLGERSEARVSLDWTEFGRDGHVTLVASLVSSHGRTTPLLWVTAPKGELAGVRNEFEDGLLLRLRECVPEGVRVTVLMDRGFADAKLFALLEELHLDYVVRVQARVQVRDEKTGKAQRASFWVPQGGRTLKLVHPRYTEQEVQVPAFVCVHKPRMKDAWCLVTSRADVTGAEVVRLYSRRFTIEETFRDVKDWRFGFSLAHTHVTSPERRDRLLLLCALAVALLTLLGAAGEAAGIDRHWKVNTRKERQYSLLRQGCMYYDAIPRMREEWLLPLMQHFAELLRAQPFVQEALGPI